MGYEEEKILKEILQKDIIEDKEDLDLILKQLNNRKIKRKDDYSFGDRAADKIAKFAGSWTFIIIFVSLLAIWMLINIKMRDKAFDPYPFILLNLVLSCIAAIQAPLIMMSQNRQEKKDRQRAEDDFIVNLKNEIIIRDIHKTLANIENKLEKES